MKQRPQIEHDEIVFSVPTDKLNAQPNTSQETVRVSKRVPGKVYRRLSSEALSKLVLKQAMELVERTHLPKFDEPTQTAQSPQRNRKDTMPLGIPRPGAIVPSASFSLIHKKTGEIIPLKASFTIGAGQGVDYTVEDNDYMSREHAKFKIEGNALLVTDLGSLNGTFLNNEKINSFTVRARPNDIIKLADEEFIVQ